MDIVRQAGIFEQFVPREIFLLQYFKKELPQPSARDGRRVTGTHNAQQKRRRPRRRLHEEHRHVREEAATSPDHQGENRNFNNGFAIGGTSLTCNDLVF